MKISKLEKEVSKILKTIINSEDGINRMIDPVHENYKLSAKNLIRYLILRNFDLRKYHGSLSDLGVSSLRSGEGYVYSNLYNVVKNLNLINGTPFNIKSDITTIGYTKSKKIIRRHANDLFNETRKKHFTEIMVTLPIEAVEDTEIIRNMVLSGMEVARINLSKGDLRIWTKMVKAIQEVSLELKQEIKVYMDLSGPKIRTTTIKRLGKNGKVKNKIPIKKGEHLNLTSQPTFGKKSVFGKGKEQIENAEIGVSSDALIANAEIGDVLLIDDGMIKSKVVSKSKASIEVVITECFKSNIGSNKRINLPDTTLNLPALTKKDLKVLPFVCQHADILGYSVGTEKDVIKLYRQLARFNAKNIGVVFKIGNKEAFENLPEILLAGMKRSKIGVMIARGNLAAEIGFERISEVQNQILWLCEAAHIPVIWATQVLDNLAQTGIPTRAEISDVAQAVKAECVMLNEGPYINQAITVLKDVLIRMEGHSFKKKNVLRALNVAQSFVNKWTYLTSA